MRNIVKQGQSLIDYAIQESGSIESVFALASLIDVSIDADIEIGTELQTSIINVNVKQYYDDNKIIPATAITIEMDEMDGIGFMGIETDFWVR